MHEARQFSPTSDPRVFRAANGSLVTPPDGWVCVPPGDPGLTRRVKALGPSWTITERKGGKLYSHGVWVPASSWKTAFDEVESERATPEYQRRRVADIRRREEVQANYVDAFHEATLHYLHFSVRYGAYARALAEAVSEQATPVGSGTVARTQRIPLIVRVEAAVLAWMRHQTTAYDHLQIARVKGERRRVRSELAAISRAVLDAHRGDTVHDPAECSLCTAIIRRQATRTAT